MQTFLPYASFTESARVLDYRRLGKQRVEAYQILLTLKNDRKGWSNHPAVLMWKGYEHALVAYTISMCREWLSRGYKDTILTKCSDLLEPVATPTLPGWLGNPTLHASHRSNLLRKDQTFYGKYQWTESSNLPYYWPVTTTR